MNAGCDAVMAFIVVVALFVHVEASKRAFAFKSTKAMFEAIAGYGLSSFSIAPFGRVDGGIYTKATDVDDYQNLACIAGSVGDNVGDLAGRGADLLGSLAESTCAALVFAGSSLDLEDKWCFLVHLS